MIPGSLRDVGDLNAAVKIAIHDAIDHGVRVVTLAQRFEHLDAARHVADLMGARLVFARDAESAGRLLHAIDDFKPAADEALSKHRKSDSGLAVFLETIVLASNETGPGGTLSHEGLKWTREQEFHDWSLSRDAYLLLVMQIGMGMNVAEVVDRFPDAYLMPWAGLWLTTTASRKRLIARELDQDVGAELRTAASVETPRSGARETALYYALRQVSAEDDIDDHDTTVERIRKAIDEAEKMMPGLRRAVRKRFKSILNPPDVMTGTADYSGPIGRLLLILSFFLRNQPAADVLRLCSLLLPDGEVHESHIPPTLMQRWRRETADDRVQNQRRRDPPRWPDIFDATRGKYINAVGLCIGPDKSFFLNDSLAALELGRHIAAEAGILMELADVIRTRQPLGGRDDLPLGAFVHLCLGLHVMSEGILTLDDLLAVVMPPDLQPRQIGDQEEDYDVTAARRVRLALGHVVAHPAGTDALVKALLEGLFERIERINPRLAMMILAYTVLYGPDLPLSLLGPLTLRLIVGDADVHLRLRQFREILGTSLFTILGQPADTKWPAAIERWADALNIEAERSPHAGLAAAVATLTDDVLVTWQIPWGLQPLQKPGDVGPILAHRLIRTIDPSRGDPLHIDLATRLFRRSPADWLAQMRLLQTTAPADPDVALARVGEMTLQCLLDVFHILIDEIDFDEGGRRGLAPDTLSGQLDAVVWAAITPVFGFGMSPKGLVDLILAAPPRQQGSVAYPPALLDLYAPSVLMQWRFRRFGAGPLAVGSNDHKDLRATLDRIVRGVDDAGRRKAVATAFRALIAAEERLVSFFNAHGLTATRARHEARLACWKRTAFAFAPITMPEPQPASGNPHAPKP